MLRVAAKAQMPDSCDFDGARAVEALRVVSVSIRHGNLGAESRKERAGSDREVWSGPGNAIFAGSADLDAERGV